MKRGIKIPACLQDVPVLMFCIFKMLIIVVVFVWVLYLFTPSTAHVSFVSNGMRNLDAAVGYMDISNFTTRGVNIESGEPFTVSVSVGTLVIDGIEFSGGFGFHLEIIPRRENNNRHAAFSIRYSLDGMAGSFALQSATIWAGSTSDGEGWSSGFFNAADVRNPSSVSIRVPDNYFAAGPSQFQISRFTNVSLDFYSATDLDIGHLSSPWRFYDTFIVDFEGNRTPVSEIKIAAGRTVFYVSSNGGQDLNLNISGLTDEQNGASIFMRGVRDFSGNGNGVVTFFQSLSANEYRLNNQSVLFRSNGGLEANIFLNESLSEFSVNGMAREARISGTNLFPSFSGWFHNNVYMTPTALFTTILGGVAIMLNNKNTVTPRKKDNTKADD